MGYGIRRNDQVLVTTGKDRGRRGRVLRIEKSDRVFVEGLNMVKRHYGQRQNIRQTGITMKEAPLDISNVQIICPACNKPSRIGTRLLGDGSKARFCKECDEVLE